MSRVEQQQPMQSQGGGSAGGFDLKGGVIYGAGAWIVGIVLTGVLAWVEFKDAAQAMDNMGGSGEFSDFGGAAESLPSAVDFVGWLFYNAHMVDVGLSFMGQGIWFNFVTASVNLTGQISQMADQSGVSEMEASLEQLFSTIPTPVWLLVPVVVLVVAGYAVASRGGAYDTSQGAKAGASIALGYLALAVGGTFVFSWSLSGGNLGMSLSVAPQLMKAAGLMGLVYPAVFGGIGGAIAGSTGDQPTGRHAGTTRQPPQGQPGYQQAGQQPAAGRQGRQPQAGQQNQQAQHGQQGGYQQGQQPTGGQQNQQQPTSRRESRQGQQRGQQPTGGQQGNRQRSPQDKQSRATGEGQQSDEGTQDSNRRDGDERP